MSMAWYFKSKTALPRPPRDAHVPREPGLGQPARLVELEARAREGGGGVGGAGLLDAGQPIGKAERDARRAGGGRLVDARAEQRLARFGRQVDEPVPGTRRRGTSIGRSWTVPSARGTPSRATFSAT